MARDTRHALQPKTDHDGLSRQLAVLAAKRAVRNQLQAPLESVFASKPASIHKSDAYKLWSGLNRASQDRMWKLLSEQIDNDTTRLNQVAAQSIENPLGSLRLSASAVPEYMQGQTIHGQPGGYLLDRHASDIGAGVLYEAGGNVYALGQGIGKTDSKAERLIHHILELRPDLRPKRILELGCSAGAQTADYPKAFPKAEVHALDISPSMLRYAHARAQLLGSAVHFHQMDAAQTDFDNKHFDLIVSHNLFHEVASNHVNKIMTECRRLLAPGGLCVHQDVPIQAKNLPPFQQFLSSWQTKNNDEPFWDDFAHTDLAQAMIAVGFDKERVKTEYLKAKDAPIPWYVVSAEA